MKLLAVGDIHLGRQPARLTDALLDRLPARELGPAGAWSKTVDFAIQQGVTAVLMAGDVVQQDDDFFEACGDLHRGVERLTKAGIEVVGVAGNHDVEVLPYLADAVNGFRLLGRGGRWETHGIEAGGRSVQVVGWSFPQRVVLDSPLTDVPRRDDHTLTLGLLHCDRGQSNSRYAPVPASALDACMFDGWLLGHIHRPDRLEGPRPSGYLGSLSGLHSGERGAHGPWLLEAGPDGFRVEHIPLAPLRWEVLKVDVDGLDDPKQVRVRVSRTIEAFHDQLIRNTWTPAAVGYRLELVGRTRLRAEIERTFADDDPRDLADQHGDILHFVHDVRMRVSPQQDLNHLAATKDPVGLLARRVIELRRRESSERRHLIDAARRRFEMVRQKSQFTSLGPGTMDDEAVVEMLEGAALQALDLLLRQMEVVS